MAAKTTKPVNPTKPSSRLERVCYVNPASAIRRPMSELMGLERGKREVSLLIPTVRGKKAALHHADHDGTVKIYTYGAISLPFSPFEWPIPSPYYFVQAWRVLKNNDVIHMWAHFYLNNLIFLLLSYFFPKKKIIISIDAFPGYSSSFGPFLDFLFKVYTWTVCRVFYGRANVITLYGNALLPAAKQSGIAQKKIVVLPTGIVPRNVPIERDAVRKELGLPRSTKLVAYAGLVNPRKRVDSVLEVARAIPEATFIIIGNGPSQTKLEAYAREQGLTNVRFLGWRKDVLRLVGASDVLLFPSSAEGLPGVVMEAMVLGTPVVTTRIPCTTDLITDGEEGFLTAVGDHPAMVKKTRILLTNKRLVARFVANAKKKMHTNHSWDTLLPRYEALYT